MSEPNGMQVIRKSVTVMINLTTLAQQVMGGVTMLGKPDLDLSDIDRMYAGDGEYITTGAVACNGKTSRENNRDTLVVDIKLETGADEAFISSVLEILQGRLLELIEHTALILSGVD